MKISVIIRTYNEIRHIEAVLKSIKKQSYGNYEIIVVDSGSNDGTIDVIKKYNCNIVNIRKEDFNYSYASNVGCENASGDILLFLSGHSILCKKNYFLKLVKYYKKYNIDGCYGDLVPYFRGGLYEKIFYYAGYMKNIFTPKKCDYDIHPGILSCSNASIKKSVYEKHKFDVELGTGAEDVEMAKFILTNGGKIMYFRSLLVRHSHHKNSRQFKNELRKLRGQYNNALRIINQKYGANYEIKE